MNHATITGAPPIGSSKNRRREKYFHSRPRQRARAGGGWCSKSDENANWQIIVELGGDSERILLAKEMLKEGRPCKVIAGAMAFGRASNFSAWFRRNVGLSPTRWLEHSGTVSSIFERVKIAENILKSGEKKLARVAQASGWHSPQAMCAAFRRVHGIPTKMWCKKHTS